MAKAIPAKTKKHPNKKDRVKAGMVFGKLKVLRRMGSPTGSTGTYWKVKCSCGGPKSVFTIKEQYLFRKGNPKRDCGCSLRGAPSQFPSEYSVWYMMNRRCTDPGHVSWDYYGGAGIQVYPEWRADCADHLGFVRWLSYMGMRPSAIHTLDRINPFKNYEPGNVRWATPKEQGSNKREHWARKSKQKPTVDV